MPCLICGEPKTVRSHLIPKAIVAAIADKNGVVLGSRDHRGAKPSQRGRFNDYLLCAAHEARTGLFDKYGTEFLRRADRKFESERPTTSFTVANPEPRLLFQFALSLVWREAHSSPSGEKRGGLGPYNDAVAEAIFGDGALDWTLFVERQKVMITRDQPLRWIAPPYLSRFMDMRCWLFSLAGCGFQLVADRRARQMFQEFAANENDPATVMVSEEMPYTDLGAFRPIFANMRRRN